MTAARRERKARSPFTIVAWAALIALWTGFACAATTTMVVTNRHTGLAIDGFDPVSYFVDATPKTGRPDLEMRSGGATWRFANEGNRAAFAAAPTVYQPRFGGYDPVAITRGAATAGNPELWLIARQRLYLFYNEAARAAFAADPDQVIEAAERHWPRMQRTLSP